MEQTTRRRTRMEQTTRRTMDFFFQFVLLHHCNYVEQWIDDFCARRLRKRDEVDVFRDVIENVVLPRPNTASES